MKPLCNNCGINRPLVYCRSDAARLCLHCDAHVHSANPVSKRHVRAQLCDHCLAQPAASRFPDGRLALCRLCDIKAGWPFEAVGSSSLRVPAPFYSGSHSKDELSVLLSSLSIPVDGSWATSEPPFVPSFNLGTDGLSRIPEPIKPEPTLFPSSFSYIDPDLATACSWGQDQTPFCAIDANLPKLDYGVGNEGQLCEGLKIGEQGFNAYSENGMLGCLQLHSRSPFQSFGLDEIFMQKNLSFASSNCHLENIEFSSNALDFVSLTSCMASISTISRETNSTIDQLLLNLDDNEPIFSTGNICSNTSIPLSNLTAETSRGSNQEIINLRKRARSEACMRFIEKKKQRLKGLADNKHAKCASRKASADIKMRAKGRFVKTGGSFGQDPPPENK